MVVVKWKVFRDGPQLQVDYHDEGATFDEIEGNLCVYDDNNVMIAMYRDWHCVELNEDED